MSEVNVTVEKVPRRATNDISDIDGSKPTSNIKPLSGRNEAVSPDTMRVAGTGALTANQLRLSSIGYNLINNKNHGPKSTSSHMSHMSAFAYPNAKQRTLNVGDINGPKRNCYGQIEKQSFDSSKFPIYAGVRKDIPKQQFSDSGNFLAPSKNASQAFAHLDMSKSNYKKYLSSHSHLAQLEKNKNSQGAAPQDMTVAGVPLTRDENAVQASLLHTIKEIADSRTRKTSLDLPVNPMRYDPHSVSVSNDGYWNTGKQQVAAKKTINLQDGYVRLFAADSGDAAKSLGESKKLGKRIFEEPRPKGNDPRPSIGKW